MLEDSYSPRRLPLQPDETAGKLFERDGAVVFVPVIEEVEEHTDIFFVVEVQTLDSSRRNCRAQKMGACPALRKCTSTQPLGDHSGSQDPL